VIPAGGLRGWLSDHVRQLFLVAIALLLAFWVLRGCLPGGDSRHLPGYLMDRIEDRYTKCIDYFPIVPGERRQPECGRVTVEVVGLGSLPASASSQGITQAVCYRVTYTNPSLTNQGASTGHELVWNERTSSKVTVEQNGEWQLYPDQEQQDRARWSEYACPAGYES
jgi:hypothetical protein